jgi:hypothetical protein
LERAHDGLGVDGHAEEQLWSRAVVAGPLSLTHLVPELVGDGVRLFDASTLRASLTTLDVSASGQS